MIGGKAHPWVKEPPLPEFDPAAELRTSGGTAPGPPMWQSCSSAPIPPSNTKARDREDLGLPGNQEELVKAVLAANPRTIVVLMSAGPLAVPWIKEHVPAMLQAWWPGEEGGNAIADVLFGNAEPGGRLPYTVYASEAQVPPLDEYDISKGFTYMYLKGEPLYAFGHGLSYTTIDVLRI